VVRTHSTVLTIILLLAALLCPVAASAQTSPAIAHVQTAEEALVQDAGQYARRYGVALDEAVRRLRAQAESVAITDRLETLYQDRLAGISIEHRPQFRIIVNLTGSQPVPDERVMAGGMTVPIVFRTGAKATRERVIWAITYHQAQIRAMLATPPAMGLDPRTGELVIITGPKTVAAFGTADALRDGIGALTGVPVQIRMQDRTDVNLDGAGASADAAIGTGEIEGGSRIEGIAPDDGKRYLCTTGFVVTDGRRNGVTTAAHCLDSMVYRDPQRGTIPLDFVNGWGWGYRDVQIHASDRALRPLFYADTARTVARAVTGQRSRASTRAGDFVCHRGERTGYSCAPVELTDFAPAGDLCAGPCVPTWVTVAGPDCKGGDSGAPVFAGTIALGVVKGGSYRPDGSCAFYFYMSTDYLPAGWTLLAE